MIRRGPLYWEWKYREQNPSLYKTTMIPSYVEPKEALDGVMQAIIPNNSSEVFTGGWELTEEEILAGKKGILADDVPAKGREFKN